MRPPHPHAENQSKSGQQHTGYKWRAVAIVEHRFVEKIDFKHFQNTGRHTVCSIQRAGYFLKKQAKPACEGKLV